MKLFSQLFRKIDSTTSSNAKIKALVEFFAEADDKDKIWAIALFTHKRPKRSVNTNLLRTWAAEHGSIKTWLFEESYHIVGDLAETIALVLPQNQSTTHHNLDYWVNYIANLRDKEEHEKKDAVLSAWKSLDKDETFLFNKLITGGFRMGVSQKSIIKALSKYLSLEENKVAHRLMGNWDPFETEFSTLLLEENLSENLSKPYPFYLAYALDKELEEIGEPGQWFAEWKYDGIRSQLIHREGEVYLWSRGEDLINESFPEFSIIPQFETRSFVLDGELLVIIDDEIQSFNRLQKRLGRKKPGKKTLKDHPAGIIVYDILEFEGKDLRPYPQDERRKVLVELFNELHESLPLKISPLIDFDDWDELSDKRDSSRLIKAEGLMLKSKKGEYKTGRKKGDWWKWKVDPMTVDAVMIYAQRGHGRRSNLYTDFTFAVWEGESLVPFTKAYSGLTDDEFREVSQFVKKNTIERFGPVSSVNPTLVFEIAFEGIAESSRHKSGVALRFPRIKRWRKDKQAQEADTLDNVKSLL